MVRGSVSIFFIIVLITLGAIALAGGIFPKLPSESLPVREAIPDPSSVAPDEKKSLQLKTLKFKEECSETITMDLLLDRTGSMNKATPMGQTKISRLKEAVLALTNSLSDSSIIGIQSFSSDTLTYADNITNDIPISFYKDVSKIISPKVNALIANGNTPTHNALAFSLDRLREGISKFQGRKFNFILISDGEPVPPNQDPRLYTPNPADEIKNLGISV